MNISDIIKNNPGIADSLTLKLTGNELKDFAIFCFEEGMKEKPPPDPQEELYTTEQFADMLKVSKVTLWNWDRKNITDPVRIGNTKRYRKSDIRAFSYD